MRDVNERQGPLARTFGVQVRNAVFGHDIAHVSARRYRAGAGLKRRDDT